MTLDESLRAIESSWADELAPLPVAHDSNLTNDDVGKLNFVVAEPVCDGEELSLTLWVENPSQDTVQLVTGGFGLMPNMLSVPYIGPPLQPPAPPMPTAIRIPPRSRVPYRRSFRLACYRIEESSWDHGWTFSAPGSQIIASGIVRLDVDTTGP